MSKFNFGGRTVPPTEFKVTIIPDMEPNTVVAVGADGSVGVAKWEAPVDEPFVIDPKLLAFLIVRAIRLGETNIAQDLLRTQDTGMTVTPRLWEYTLCANCGWIKDHWSLTPVIGICNWCTNDGNVANSFRGQQTFMHLSSKLTDSFAEHLAYALETTLTCNS